MKIINTTPVAIHIPHSWGILVLQYYCDMYIHDNIIAKTHAYSVVLVVSPAKSRQLFVEKQANFPGYKRHATVLCVYRS